MSRLVAAAFLGAALVDPKNALTATIAFFVVAQVFLWLLYSSGPGWTWLLFGRRASTPDALGEATFRDKLRVAAKLCHLERFDEALTILDQASRLRPGDVSVALARGWCLRRTGRLSEAIKILERAAMYEPEEAVVAFALACAWSQSGRLPLALDALSLAVDLDPGLREVIAGEPDLIAIQGEADFARLLAGRLTGPQ